MNRRHLTVRDCLAKGAGFLGLEIKMPLLIRLPSLDADSPAEYLNVLDRKKTAVQRHLRRTGLGGYETDFLATVLAGCEQRKSGFIFYDVGAHIGLYSALAAKLFGADGYAFEATPETSKDAARLRNDNRLSYQIIPKAVSSSVGEISFHISPKAETSNSLNPAFRPGGDTITVPVTSLDAFTGGNSRDPDIVKIDVETHEPDVIIGGLDMLRRAKPTIACEFLPSINIARLAEALTALEGIGYKFLHILPETPWKPRSIAEVLGNLHSEERDWLLVPSELPEDFYMRREAWKAALVKCGPETNLLVEGKKPKP